MDSLSWTEREEERKNSEQAKAQRVSLSAFSLAIRVGNAPSDDNSESSIKSAPRVRNFGVVCLSRIREKKSLGDRVTPATFDRDELVAELLHDNYSPALIELP